jgi:tRNA pseudouridine13 synthase
VDAADGLPLVTPDLPGTGGSLRASPADFVVEEIPLYELSGDGEHVHLRIRREDLTTRDVQRRLAEAFGIAERDVGCAGQKDRIARATQSFSVPVRAGTAEDAAAVAARATGLEVLAARRHGNKLGRGHLLGNRFEIVVHGTVAGAAPRARAVLDALAARGAPNFFGEQRLGAGARNARRGRRRLEGGPRSWTARMELSAWQASLFNAWLERRMERGLLDRVIAGDLARKEETGGLFEVEDEAAEQPRCLRGEISATGPIFGARMRWAGGSAGDLERAVLEASGVRVDALGRARLDGSRRAARFFPREIEIEEADDALRIRFRLPKGAYATVVMREVTKSPA